MPIEIDTTWMTAEREAPLLVLGPSLGTSAEQLWGRTVAQLEDTFSILAWDLPGHGGSPVGGAFLVEDLGDAVLAAVGTASRGSGAPGDRPFLYAGDSLGGAVGLQLMVAAPQRVRAACLISTGSRIGAPHEWRARAALVRADGTAAVVTGSIERWFSRRSHEERSPMIDALVTTLRSVDAEGYALACEALAAFDLTARLPEIRQPVLAVAGAEDAPTPVSSLRQIAGGVADGTLVVVEDAAHLPPAEVPGAVAELLRQFFATAP